MLTIPLTIEVFSHVLSQRGLLQPFSPLLQPLLAPGDKLVIELQCPPGYIYIVSGLKLVCRPSENVLVSFGFDGKTVVPQFVCGEILGELVDFSRYGFPWIVQDKIRAYMENIGDADTRVEILVMGAFVDQHVYNLLQERYGRAIFEWLKSKS